MNLVTWINKKILRRKVDQFYVSKIDKFLADFDEKNIEKSASQLHEIEKHRRIARMRDNPEPQDKNAKIWEGF